METINTVTPEVKPASIIQKNKMPIIGFICMLATPIPALLARHYANLFGDFLEYSMAVKISSWVTIILPVAGLVIGIRSLFRKKEIGKLGYALAIVTVIMCNPFFFLIVSFIAMITGVKFAGLSRM